MLSRTLKSASLCLFVLTLACGTLLAQSRVSDFFHVTSSPDITPALGLGSDTTVTIYSNLGPTSTNDYYDLDGYCVTGNNQSSCGTTEQWIGAPFTPAKASHVTGLQVAVGYFAGTNEFELSLYTDVSGTPGTSLKTVIVKNAPTFGTCCTLVNANLGTPGISVNAATQYWVVATANDTAAPTFSGAWAFTNFANVAYNPAQAGWTTFFDLGAEAFSVKGTTP